MEPIAITLLVVFLSLAVFLIVLFLTGIKVVRQTEECVVETLGKYSRTLTTGIHYVLPIFSKIAKKVSLKEQIYDFPPQQVITKDNVTMQIDTIVFFQVVDSKLYCYGVENPIAGIQALTSTTIRNLIGDLDLDHTLTSRDFINNKMRAIIDEATDPWGIKVTRVEVKNILPPRDIQEAMEKQMRAEREKREKILIAEGQKTSAITIAEGHKEATILNADAEKQAKIKAAEAEAESILKIKKAQAEGELLLRKAEADGIKMINEAHPSHEALSLRSFEAFEKVSEGKATKIIVPSNLQDLTSYASVFQEIMKPEEKEAPKASVKKPAPKKEEEEKEETGAEAPHVYQEHPLN